MSTSGLKVGREFALYLAIGAVFGLAILAQFVARDLPHIHPEIVYAYALFLFFWGGTYPFLLLIGYGIEVVANLFTGSEERIDLR
jgi:hypothetical protein